MAHRIDPLVYRFIVEKLYLGLMPAAILRLLELEQSYKGKLVGKRTIERIAHDVREIRAKDTSPAWRFVNSDPETARYLLPIIWEIADMGGDPDVVTEDIAHAIVLICITLDLSPERTLPLQLLQMGVICANQSYEKYATETATVNLYMAKYLKITQGLDRIAKVEFDDGKMFKFMADVDERYLHIVERLGLTKMDPFSIQLFKVSKVL